jgi:hypothetical protein
VTGDSGTYILCLQPRAWYKITATYGNLKHTVSPANIPDTGNGTYGYDINLTGDTTIEGIPTPDSPWKGKGVYVTVAPADGGEPAVAVTGDDGRFSLTVRPGVYYTVTAVTYDLFGTPFTADIYYRNTVSCTNVKPGTDETVLLEYFTRRPATDPATPVTLIVNGTVGVIGKKAEPPVHTPTSPVPSVGRVYLDNETVRGARVEAVSVDGADRVSATTNDSGIYVLKLEPGVLYRATATYKGLKHTIWPVSETQNPADGRNDIHLTPSHKSIIAVAYDDNREYNSTPALIEAIPADGSEPAASVTNGPGWYYLNVKPGVRYGLIGRCYDPYGQNGDFFINYPQDSFDRVIIPQQDETIIASMSITFHHAPMSIYMWRNPATGSYDPFKKPVPVKVTGRVFIDDRPADGANVTAVLSGSSEIEASTIADARGNYVLNLTSRRQYEIAATWGGRIHSVRPVVAQDYTTGICDIQLYQRSASFISGILSLDSKWPVLPGNVITAVPVGGGETVTAVTGARGNYSLNVKPLTYYDISGTSAGTEGMNHSLRFYYRNGVSCSGFMLRPDETVLIDYAV